MSDGSDPGVFSERAGDGFPERAGNGFPERIGGRFSGKGRERFSENDMETLDRWGRMLYCVER